MVNDKPTSNSCILGRESQEAYWNKKWVSAWISKVTNFGSTVDLVLKSNTWKNWNVGITVSLRLGNLSVKVMNFDPVSLLGFSALCQQYCGVIEIICHAMCVQLCKIVGNWFSNTLDKPHWSGDAYSWGSPSQHINATCVSGDDGARFVCIVRDIHR